jgi:hypothetical protein
MSLGYYRLGQSYPRTKRRQAYPRKRRYPFVGKTGKAGATHDILTFTETVVLSHIRLSGGLDTLTFIETITKQHIRKLAQADTITITDAASVRHIFPRSIVGDHITFSEIILYLKGKGASEHLTFTEAIAVQKHFNRTVNQSLNFTDTNNAGGTKHFTIHEDVFALVETIHPQPIYVRSLTDALSFSDFPLETKSKAFYDVLTLTEIYAPKKILKRSLNDTLAITDSAVRYGRPLRAVQHTLAFIDAVVVNKHGVLVGANTLTFSETIAFTKIKTLHQTLAFTDGVAVSRLRKIYLTQADHLLLDDTTTRKTTLHRSIYDSVAFENDFIKIPVKLGYGVDSTGQIFTFPVVTVTKVSPIVILQGVVSVITLPRPEFGDTQTGVNKLNLLRSMTGNVFTYKHTSNRFQLKYPFELTRLKVLELRTFIQNNYNNYIIMTNWKGSVWVVKLTNNPFAISNKSYTTTDYGRSTITLEFEGVKVSG